MATAHVKKQDILPCIYCVDVLAVNVSICDKNNVKNECAWRIVIVKCEYNRRGVVEVI